VLFREVMAVCCGNCRKHISVDFVAIRGLTIILPVVLYGCGTCSPTLREEHKLRVFENRVLRRILEPKREEVRWEWRKLHKEELNDLYCSSNIFSDKIEKNEVGGACSTYGGEERHIPVFGGET
jgi:hypothetical protein